MRRFILVLFVVVLAVVAYETFKHQPMVANTAVALPTVQSSVLA